MTALRRPGLRFVVEAVVIVLTAVVTGFMHLGPWGIGGAVAVVWVLVAMLEYSLSHPRERKEPPLIETLPAAEPVTSDAVRVLPRTRRPEPVERTPEPEPVAVVPEPAAPAPEPEPESEPEPEPEPEPVEAREWNVWELDRALRDAGTLTEEQEFLLIYLRDYAGSDGLLPVDFDALVRESFGDVLGTPAG